MKKTFLEIMALEAKNYQGLDQIHQLIQTDAELVNIPYQPLYLAIKSLNSDEVAKILPRLSIEQRQTFRDLDLWSRDNIDANAFNFWIQAYEGCQEEFIRFEMAQSPEFLLFLKARINIWTFDVEEPLYPDHDFYFLTDDSLLLIEYDETFEYAHEVRELIRQLYGTWGVEKAYTFLFKMVSTSYLQLEENEYTLKKERLRDFGFVDYHEALNVDTAFANIAVMDNYLQKKVKSTGEIDRVSHNQILDSTSLRPYEALGDIEKELALLEDEKRQEFLQFNFMRLVNAGLALNEALKAGSLAVSRVGELTRSLLELGFDYIKSQSYGQGLEEGIFSKYEFTDIYRVGVTLVRSELRKVKKALSSHQFDGEDEAFLGEYWVEFIQNSFLRPSRFRPDLADKAKLLNSMIVYTPWAVQCQLLIEQMPFISSMRTSFSELKNNGRLQDEYYLNYQVPEIDFESILLSSFINHFLGHFEKHKGEKLGLKVDEIKEFLIAIGADSGKLTITDELREKRDQFLTSFGMDQKSIFQDYLNTILTRHLDGYDLSEMSDDDFKHMGGPILLV